MADKSLRGFTLIEILIAMTLLSIMVLLLFSSLKMAADSWNAGERRTLDVNKKAVVYQFFKQRLTTIRPLLSPSNQLTNAAGTAQQPLFLGSPQSVRFVAPLPYSSGRKGLQIFEVGLNPENTSVLMVALSPYQQLNAVEPERTILLTHIKAFLFSYFGQIDQNSPATWQNSWVGSVLLPKLIKVSILLDDDSFWPDMIIPVKINGQYTPSNVAPDVPN